MEKITVSVFIIVTEFIVLFVYVTKNIIDDNYRYKSW